MNDTNYSIAEEYSLPSKGIIYTPNIDPQVRLKSMTTLHEKKLLSLGTSESIYKVLAEIIDDCMVDKKAISSYDMAFGDFEFLLHKLRIVTFGPDYNIVARCPICNFFQEDKISLDDFESYETTEDIQSKLTVLLPRSKKEVKVKLITPRLKDNINLRVKQITKKGNVEGDPTIIVTMESIIDTVDGQKLNPAQLIRFVEELPMMDSKVLSSIERNIKIGLDTSIPMECPVCSHDYFFPFPFNKEFFDPTI